MTTTAAGAGPALPPLPDVARTRLENSRAGRPCFTSDLSVNEFVLVTQAGFEPLGMVMGTSVYHVGTQQGNWRTSQELGYLSQAMYNVRELAMGRMEAEAAQLGADGVLGVVLRPMNYGFFSDVIEYIAFGTAVRATDSAQSYRTPDGRPFTTTLSGQDFWTLWQHGWLPRRLVLGSCVYHVAHQTLRQTISQAGQNAELPQFTQALYDARELAMARMQYEGQQIGADGVVGTTVNDHRYWGEHAVEFFALGTAVNRVRPDANPVQPSLTMPLTG
ncbi:heavy metal-binding domain-containing protein [Streptomyces sp. PTM05]|uniref:Heavy metal-binding domain-containing protein n=1 Tax=Streptantibioticus parmotrematis TaxID=2873249 RepID=A0ABS7QZC6_9ACTN|nr:heavy metal-binding domain-containing protein [Streptantibioticus parmotrematis]MBY8888568.1 heavy metal-binding domain-containing protein [Streptantibioticus parmotrematis]